MFSIIFPFYTFYFLLKIQYIVELVWIHIWTSTEYRFYRFPAGRQSRLSSNRLDILSGRLPDIALARINLFTNFNCNAFRVGLYVRPYVHLYFRTHVRQIWSMHEVLLTYCYSIKNLRNNAFAWWMKGIFVV